MRLLTEMLLALFATLFGAGEAAVFYGIVDWGLGYEVTWPLVLAVGFATQSVWQYRMRVDLEKEGLL